MNDDCGLCTLERCRGGFWIEVERMGSKMTLCKWCTEVILVAAAMKSLLELTKDQGRKKENED